MQRQDLTTLVILSALNIAVNIAPTYAAEFKVLYNFKGGTDDGSSPEADLQPLHHRLLGTTLTGGSANVGTIFSFSLHTGTLKILHSFTGGSDGSYPAAGLLLVGTTAYGTTVSGGSSTEGTVYALNEDNGNEKVLYSFTGGKDGANPQSRLIEYNGLLYGTTMNGGGGSCGFGCGTVFSIDTASGAEKTVYTFQGGSDGANPPAGLVRVGRSLRGATTSGGAGNAGTVFTLNPETGVEKVVHNFDVQGDGVNPISSLLNVNGTLYGTTVAGGISGDGLGSVYAINRRTNAEHVVYKFTGPNDGALPEGDVIDLGGILYGTTSIGGDSNNGVVFSVDPASGSEHVIHAFNGGDGDFPSAGLANIGGVLYGTTYDGGSSGNGVIFAITP